MTSSVWMMFRTLLWSVPIAATLGLEARAQDLVQGDLIQFNNNGAWSWFEDERAILDLSGGKLLVSSIADVSGLEGSSRNADVEVATFDLATRQTSLFTLGTSDWADDHNTAALWVRPDGRYLAVYANHGSDDLSRYRISTNPADGSSWQSQQIYDHNSGSPGATYSNIHYLSAGGGQLYNFTRTNGYDPNYIVSSDNGSTWSYGGYLAKDPFTSDSQRPYVKYTSNGENRIYFITTESHPRNYNNGIYAGYLQRELVSGNWTDRLYAMDGALIGDPGVNGATAPYAADFTQIIAGNENFDGTIRSHAWTTDLALDSSGNPYAIFTSRTGSSPGNTADHRFYYARWTGSAWETHELARAGGFLYSSESDYTGLAALDPNDPNTVYISTKIDPRDTSGNTTFAHYEIMKGTTSNDGATWSWSAITQDSTVDNIRPIAPQGDASNNALLWLRGTYTTYTNFDMAVVGLVGPEDNRANPLQYVDASTSNTMRVTGGVWHTAASSSSGDDDNLWHERAGFGNNGQVFTADESGDENAPLLVTEASGLSAGEYDIWVLFWSNTNADWQIQAGLTEDAVTLFDKQSSQHILLDELEVAQLTEFDHMGQEHGLYRAYLGRQLVDASGVIRVYINDGIGTAETARTWYDGIAYAPAPEPGVLSLLVVMGAMTGLGRRSRQRHVHCPHH